MTSTGKKKYFENRMRRRSAVIVAVALTAGAALAASALGHNANTYPQKRPAANYQIDVYFGKNVPGGRTRSRVLNGARAWNRLGRKHVFVGHRKAIDYPGRCPQRGGQDIGFVRWARIDGDPVKGDTLATNRNCIYKSTAELAGFRQTYDSAQGSWYRGTGNAPNGRNDMWSVATHEMGHAAGRDNHYAKNDPKNPCPLDSSRNTMCWSIPRGSEMMRTPGQHDKHTFKRVYPAR